MGRDDATGPNPDARVALSARQLGISMQDRLGAADAYNVSFAYRFGPTVDVARLQAALERSIGRHEALRTVFGDDAGEVVGRVLDPSTSLDLVTARVTAAEADLVLETSWRTPFDLATERPVRACLLDVDGIHHVLSVTVHHIVFDDWSMGLLLDEIAAAYADPTTTTTAPPDDDDDLMAAHRDRIAGSRLTPGAAARRLRALGSAVDRLRDAPDRLDLPRSRLEAGEGRSWSGAAQEAVLDPALADRIRRVAAEAGCTEYVVYLAAWAVLVALYAQHEDIAIGTPVADRAGPGTDQLVGYFLSTLVVRQRIRSDAGLVEIVEQTRDAFYDALDDASQVAYEDVVRELAGGRDDPSAPLFAAWFAMDDGSADLQLPGVDVERIEVPSTTAKFELAMFVSLHPLGPRIGIEHAAPLYDGQVVAAMLGHYERVLGALADEPGLQLRHLDVLSPDEHATLRRWGRRGEPAPAARDLAGEFHRAAAATPGEIAVEHGPDAVSYADLEAMADLVASRLAAAGIGPGDVVGVSVARSPLMVAAVLGVLGVGAAYVALDAGYPLERLRYMIEDSDIDTVVTDAAAASRFDALPVTALDVSGEDRPDPSARTSARTPVRATVPPGSPAYVTYTSGSTGRPKGIRMSHRAVWNLLAWQQSHYEVVRLGSRTLQFAALSFDVSAQEIFGALCFGGTLVLIDESERDAVHDIMRIVRDRRVERVFMAAPALLEAVDSAHALEVVPEHLRVLISGSEQLVVTAALRAWLGSQPRARLYNEYGPSETHVATMYEAAPDPADWPTWLPIGRPVGETEIRVLDARGLRTPPGVVGEICIAGPGLADGYSRLARTTAAAFVPDPFGDVPGSRMYRTGDLARFLPSGDLEYLGRRDSQIKIRGFRVELEEIRAVLDDAEPVAQSFVTTALAQGTNTIVAYWSRRADATGGAAALGARLAERLPAYMIPSRLIEVDEFPLTAHGKIDQRALAETAGADDADSHHGSGAKPLAATGDPLAAAIAGVIGRLVGRTDVGEHEDFFDIGGHSLLANRLVWTLQAEQLATVSLRGIFDGRTAARIAAAAEAPRRAEPALRPTADAHTRLAALIDHIGDH